MLAFGAAAPAVRARRLGAPGAPPACPGRRGTRPAHRRAAAERLFADAQRGDSEEGTGQGQPHSSLAFCTCIQPELRALSKELEPFDGGAKAIMDDVYVFGPAAQVFPAIERFVSALRRLTGLQINQGKSACFSRGYNLEGCPWRQRAGVPVGTVALAGVDGAAGPGTGIMVGGCPSASRRL